MNNFHIIYYDNLKEIRSDWQRIYSLSSLPYFCSLEWHGVVLSFFRRTFLTKKVNKLKYFIAKKNNTTQLIGFFYIKKIRGKKILNFTHLVGPSDYYDFIYTDEVDSEFIKNVIEQIVKDTNICDVSFSNIRENSKIHETLRKYYNLLNFDSLDCVCIDVNVSYDLHLKTLSKNAKQNLRTANNRINNNKIDKEIVFLNNESSNSIDFQYLKSIYKNRNSHKKQFQSWKSKLYRFLDNPFGRAIDMFDLKSIMNTDFVLGILRLDDKIAAYFFGVKNKSGLEINRVAINDEFKYYSPGMILLDEYIKQSFESSVGIIDLTVGDEKYKYDLGGKTHKIFNISGKICLD